MVSDLLKLENLQEREYDKMVANVMRVRMDIVRGNQLKKAIG